LTKIELADHAGHVTTTDAEEIVLPALLRAARGSYGHAVRASLAASGYDNVPRNGAFVLGGMVNHGGSAADLVRQLGVSKQAASQLIDVLVIRGYLQREVDPHDRRRQTLEVTERGRGAAAAVRSAVLSVDKQLAELLSPDELAGMRAGLVALSTIRERLEDEARSAAGAAQTDG
jgi:DNA-binding MarR family transcriptional regulator